MALQIAQDLERPREPPSKSKIHDPLFFLESPSSILSNLELKMPLRTCKIRYDCQARWAGGAPADAPKTAEEALARIDQLYKDGVPFFTKESIRSAFEQMERPPTDDGKVFIKGVDGALIEFENRPNATRERVRLAEDEELVL